MVRWKHLWPRMGVLLIAVLLINLFSSPLARWMIVMSGQTITGARIDVEAVEVDLLNGRLRLRDLQIADPRNPMRNLLQSNLTDLEINPGRLWHRQFVFDQGKIRQVQFGTPRTKSGALEDTSQPTALEPTTTRNLHQRPENILAKAWLDNLESQLPLIVESNLETVQVANELDDRWPDEFDKQRKFAGQLKRRAETIKKNLAQRSENPLRNMDRFQAAMADARQLFDQVEQAKRFVHNLSQQFEVDRLRLIAAKKRDESKIQSLPKQVAIDAQQLTDLLLNEQKAQTITEVIAWARWFREMIPNPERDFLPTERRGVDIQFRRQPSLLFRNLHIDGQGSIAGQHIHFAGYAQNISTTPELLDEPAGFELRGQGENHFLVSAIVDRRGPQQIDRITISCPRVSVPAKVLGTESSLLVSLHPHVMSYRLEAKLIDDQLTGQVTTHQNRTEMRAEKIHESVNSVSGQSLIESINLELSQIDAFDVTVKFEGPLDQLETQLISDLGEKFATVLNHGLRQNMKQAVAANILKLESILDSRLNQFDNMFSVNANEIMSILTKDIPAVADLRRLSNPYQTNGPNIR